MTYEYECHACAREWEEEQKITDPALERCPFCNELAAYRLISKSTFILNGKNWASKEGY